jgi:hypothetical protein
MDKKTMFAFESIEYSIHPYKYLSIAERKPPSASPKVSIPIISGNNGVELGWPVFGAILIHVAD